MFVIIFCFIPILFTILHFYLLKKRKSLDWEIKKGQICYNCKEDLNISEKESWNRIMKSEDFSKLCVSCNRDQKISSLSNPFFRWKYKFQKVLISNNKYNKITLIFPIVAFSSIILDLILKFNHIDLNLWIVYGSANIIWYLIMTWRTIYTTQKKPSE